MCSQHRNFRLSLCGFLGLALTFLSSCNPELAEVCSGKYDHSISDAITRIEPYRGMSAKPRSLASLEQVAQKEGAFSGANAAVSSTSPMDEDEREHWQAWAESELKRVEAYLDWANLHREESQKGEIARHRLKEAANRLVAFHGYSQAGRVERMLDTLHALEADRKVIQGAVCEASYSGQAGSVQSGSGQSGHSSN